MAYQLNLLKMFLSFLKHQYLAIISNKSINLGIVREEMKFAKVRPIFKKNSPLDVINYIHVSILNIVSKILQGTIYIQSKEQL